jgi:hypothetical protein
MTGRVILYRVPDEVARPVGAVWVEEVEDDVEEESEGGGGVSSSMTMTSFGGPFL